MDLKINDAYIYKCNLLLSSKSELNVTFNSDINKPYLDQEVWLIFGPTRSGKSTLMARIKSQLKQNEFESKMEETLMDQNKGKPIDISGVKVQSGFTSCTTVPNFHIFRDRMLLDLAGFLDSNENRASVISLLNNSLFSMIGKCRIMIVVNLSILFDLGNIINTYNQEFVRLLTQDNLTMGLGSCMFVFTHCDQYWKKVLEKDDRNVPEEYNEALLRKSIKSLLSDFATEYMMHKPEIGRFASFMRNKFCLVHYGYDDNKTVVGKVSSTMDMVEPLDSKSMRFNVDHINNDLGREASKIITQYHNLIKEFYKKQSTAKTKLLKEIDETNDLINKKMQNAIHLDKNAVRLQGSLTKNNERVEYLKDEIEEIKLVISKSEMKLKEVEAQFESFSGKVDDLKILNMAVLKAVLCKAKFGNDKYKVNCDLESPLGGEADMTVVIMKGSVYDSNRSKILQSRTIKEFKELKLELAFENGARMNENIDVEFKRHDAGSMFKTSSQSYHVVLCMNEVRVREANYVDMISGYFEKQLDDLKRSISSGDSKIQKNETEMTAVEGDTQTKKGQLSKIEIDFKKSVGDIKDKCQGLRNCRFNLEKIMEKNKKEITRLREDPMFKSTENLCGLLLKSNVNIANLDLFPTMKHNLNNLDQENEEILSRMAFCDQVSESNQNQAVAISNNFMKQDMDAKSKILSPRLSLI